MKKPNCNYDDFAKLDIRVGEVNEASLVEGSKKLISLMVDLGEDFGVVEILTGMQEWYAPEDFLGKKFLFLANLEPRPMMGKTSNGMLLSADLGGKPVLDPVSQDLPNGTAMW